MPTTIAVNAIAAIAAAAGVALTSYIGADNSAYDGGAVQRLSQGEAAAHANQIFQRADRSGDGALDVDEFAALSVVTAELAHLNGFVALEKSGAVQTISVPVNAPGALPGNEHARIDAVARHTFYAFAGEDGKMQQGDYLDLQSAIFASSDLNANGALTRSELSLFAQRQAYLRPEA